MSLSALSGAEGFSRAHPRVWRVSHDQQLSGGAFVTELKADTQTPAPRLSDLDEPERNRLFSELQERMPAVWDAWRLGLEDESAVVVPSVTLDPAAPGAGSLSQAFEERLLFLLCYWCQPRLRMIYVTSTPIKPSIIEYYLALLPGVIPSRAMARLSVLSSATPRRGH